MPFVNQWLFTFLDHLQVLCYLLNRFFFRLEESIFFPVFEFPDHGNGLAWIFQYGGNGGIGKPKPAAEPSFKPMGQYTYGIGIAFKSGKVLPLFNIEVFL